MVLAPLTTGACAAVAAYAAAELFANKESISAVSIELDGLTHIVPVHKVYSNDECYYAEVIKPPNNDNDITQGVLVRAELVLNHEDSFAAGEGVGIITRPGLALPVGEAAINPAPRQMILSAIRRVTSSKFRITISIDNGADIAEKTWNPQLGVVGGLSILGTTGIVRTHCKKAFLESMALTFSVASKQNNLTLILVPGNIGRMAAKRFFNNHYIAECGNDFNLAADSIRKFGWEHIILVGHPGKLAKLIQGDFDTHSDRSESGLNSIYKTANRHGFALPESFSTCEELFQSHLCTPEFVHIVAAEIAHAFSLRCFKNTSCILINLAGVELGRSD